ncbi:MAG: hypothetical protein ABI411_15805 [Tahibacter sp.]
MSSITLIYAIAAEVAPKAEFRLSQGMNQIARVGIHAGGQAIIPSGSNYTAQSVITMGHFSLTSNELNFSGTATTLLAQILEENGYFDFQLVQRPATELSAIVCENSRRNPVQIKLVEPGTPVQIFTVVDSNGSGLVSAASQWTIYAIVNGITTVTTTNPSPIVTLIGSGDDDYALNSH